MWNPVPATTLDSWDSTSTYIHEIPYLKNMTVDPSGPHSAKDAFCLLKFGDSITTNHISPAGSIHKDNPAAKYLFKQAVDRKDLNSYDSHQGNDEIMPRGTFMDIVKKFLNGEVDPITVHISTGEKLSVFDAAMPHLCRAYSSYSASIRYIPLRPRGCSSSMGMGIDLPNKVSEIKLCQDFTVASKSFSCTGLDTKNRYYYMFRNTDMVHIVATIFLQSDRILLTNSLAPNIPAGKNVEEILKTTGSRVLGNIQSGIWMIDLQDVCTCHFLCLNGCVQIFEARNLDMFQSDEFLDGNWLFQEIDVYETFSHTCNGGIFGIDHCNDDETIGILFTLRFLSFFF
ncbi:hypothetical protein GIB67_020513 [Kingdonia uniflora]|uniref:Uncharacterized protein n=1 Tax=Kingdonia uniflora TaxID=39325 RepID=A0A7J7LDS2_9MAGN|nr:hypothetical protein GIB67_020513 [Kingdonia uniflora]